MVEVLKGELASDEHQPVRIGIGERLAHDAVDDRKDGAVRTDAEPDSEDRERGESGRAFQETQAVLQVLQCRLDQGALARVVHLFLDVLHATNLQPRRSARVVECHPSFHLFGNKKIHVGLDLLVDIASPHGSGRLQRK